MQSRREHALRHDIRYLTRLAEGGRLERTDDICAVCFYQDVVALVQNGDSRAFVDSGDKLE